VDSIVLTTRALSDEDKLPAFERTTTELWMRISFLIEAIEQSTTTQEVTERA
jgi:hypothetical protein